MSIICHNYVIEGQFDKDDLFEFAEHRASRLNLRGQFRPAHAGLIEIDLEGYEELLDMFEMAMWLGPRHALITSIESTQIPVFSSPKTGFLYS